MSLVMDSSLACANDSTPRLLGSTPLSLDFLKSQPESTFTQEAVATYTEGLVRRALEKSIRRAMTSTSPVCTVAEAICDGVLDTRRMAQIALGRATDHAGEVVVLPNHNFDINRTIFHSLDGFVGKAVVSSRVGVNLFWLDSAALRISTSFASVPPAPRHDLALTEFMQNDCNFAMEHADGSFMDHLRFCYEYSYAHYKEKSPRVLLLHSIMGVATNFFPMDASKIPKLQALLTEFEFQQVAAFPSVLRLLYQGQLLRQLEQMDNTDLAKLDRVKFYRVIDNAPVEMSADEFWCQLNYQLIHLLDFLPAASWKRHADDSFLRNFSAIHAILTRAGKLQCKVDFDATEGQSLKCDQTPVSLGSLIRTVVPSAALLRMSEKAIAKFSTKIGHSLEYELQFSHADGVVDHE